MKAPVLMIQGTGSHVGKSLLTAALCRLFTQEGLRVAPFKAQNMANNSFVCADGGEIGRAQAVQAAACKIEPTVDMNPILIKPSTDLRAQIVFKGRPVATMGVDDYKEYKETAWREVCASLDRLRDFHDLVIAEGAGSPAEVNLRNQDIVNMKVAHYADADVLLVGDIDTGGVFAQFVGTLELLEPEDRRRIKGFLINKFRGDRELLQPGIDFLEKKTGIPVVGVIPYLHDHGIPEEDALPHERGGGRAAKPNAQITVDIVRFPRISNFTDFDSLEKDPRVIVRWLTRPPENRAFADLVILPGTKSTVADLEFLRESGLADYIAAASAAGKIVFGICGGYQMLGKEIRDPHGVESCVERIAGMGLLPHTTVFAPEKTTAQVRGRHAESGAAVAGYEIHMGQTAAVPGAQPLFQITQRFGKPVTVTDGIRLGNIFGTYLHGCFDNPEFLNWLMDLAISVAPESVSRTRRPLGGAKPGDRNPMADFCHRISGEGLAPRAERRPQQRPTASPAVRDTDSGATLSLDIDPFDTLAVKVRAEIVWEKMPKFARPVPR